MAAKNVQRLIGEVTNNIRGEVAGDKITGKITVNAHRARLGMVIVAAAFLSGRRFRERHF